MATLLHDLNGNKERRKEGDMLGKILMSFYSTKYKFNRHPEKLLKIYC